MSRDTTALEGTKERLRLTSLKYLNQPNMVEIICRETGPVLHEFLPRYIDI